MSEELLKNVASHYEDLAEELFTMLGSWQGITAVFAWPLVSYLAT
jgi:hypothetical protein